MKSLYGLIIMFVGGAALYFVFSYEVVEILAIALIAVGASYLDEE